MTITTSTQQGLSEAAWENFALDQPGGPPGWRPLAGEKIAPATGERESWSELLIRGRLLDALLTLNPTVPVAEHHRHLPSAECQLLALCSPY